MNSLEIAILEKSRGLKRIEKEFIKFTYDTKKPETETEFGDFFGKAIRLATDVLANDIIIIDVSIIT